jgi:hypothetical protein
MALKDWASQRPSVYSSNYHCVNITAPTPGASFSTCYPSRTRAPIFVMLNTYTPLQATLARLRTSLAGAADVLSLVNFAYSLASLLSSSLSHDPEALPHPFIISPLSNLSSPSFPFNNFAYTPILWDLRRRRVVREPGDTADDDSADANYTEAGSGKRWPAHCAPLWVPQWLDVVLRSSGLDGQCGTCLCYCHDGLLHHPQYINSSE